jgi:hypothetical protein
MSDIQNEARCFTAAFIAVVLILGTLIGQCGMNTYSTPETLCISRTNGHNLTACLKGVNSAQKER